jgi:putative oligomerization/nucleic acid binding protein/phospholipase D-like protein
MGYAVSHRLVLASAQNYPLLNLFWTMLWFFLWILWIFLLFKVIIDIFRSQDLNGWGKALWALFVIILPYLGVLVYLIVRGSSMHERDLSQVRASEEAFRGYVQEAAASAPSTAEELSKLAALRDQGVLTPAEFEAQKAKLLA